MSATSDTQSVSIDHWIARDAIPFSLELHGSFDSAVDRLLASLGASVQVLAIGEPMHVLQGGEDFLLLRNRLFQRLVAAHGFSAIAVESSCTRSPRVNAFVLGEGADKFRNVVSATTSASCRRIARSWNGCVTTTSLSRRPIVGFTSMALTVRWK